MSQYTGWPSFEESVRNCPEFLELPSTWSIDFEVNTERAYFFPTDRPTENNFVHPTKGPLPDPWILRKTKPTEDTYLVTYYNPKKRRQTTRDPRLHDDTLKGMSSKIVPQLRIATNAARNTDGDISGMRRQAISNQNLRHLYEVVHTIDPGDGSKGGMNGGVFVVRVKGSHTLNIEKRFRAEHLEFGAKKEILLTYKLNHPALMNYINAFITTANDPIASVYVEFCDRGDLDGVIEKYSERTENPRPLVPEGFVWHAFGALLDAFCYLQTGVGHIGNPNPTRAKGWIPILHRDMKPDNVLLRSRSTPGSNKYFYCVISDFGLCCEDLPPSDPNCCPWQRQHLKCGTHDYFAPEMCQSPYPRTPDELRFWPSGQGHTSKSDVWALGATIYNLCHGKGSMEHLAWADIPSSLESQKWRQGAEIRRLKEPLKIPAGYSTHLQQLILIATTWDIRRRPDAVTLMKTYKALRRSGGFDFQGEAVPLPDWATRVHSYHAPK